MIIFLDKHPEKNEVIYSTDCMTSGVTYTRTVKRSGSSIKNRERRYWLEAIDNETGEVITCEYELLDSMIA
jgi:hypothetical protein